MEFFDLRTAYLVVSVLSFFEPVATWVALRGEHNRSSLFWCVGGALAGLATMVVSLKNFLPADLVLTLANSIYAISILLRIRSLQLLRVSGQPLGVDVLFVLSLFGLVEMVRYTAGTSVMLTMLIHGLAYARLAYVAYRLGREKRQPIAHWIAVAYCLVSAILFLSIWEALASGEKVDYLRSTALNILLAMIGAVVTVGNYIGYVGLVLQDTRQRELDAVAQASRQEVSLRLGSQLAQLQRRQMAGEMSAYFAHEVRQPLTALISSAQLAGRGMRSGRLGAVEVLPMIERIVACARRVEGIVERVLTQVRPQDLERREFDLAGLLDEVRELVQSEAKARGVVLVRRSSLSRAPVLGDEVQLAQVLLNLLRNAIDAAALSPGARRVELGIELEPGGDRVRVTVRDTGPGFTEDALLRAGDPFFTTKPEGVGVGLSVSREITRQHHGVLGWRNLVTGAEVALSLPLALSSTDQEPD
jgi:signal transduction histidine kinase